jgi:phosphoribosylformylglycinamidine synthase
MSGTFENINVPPTLVSFAVATQEIDGIISPEFKQIGSRIVWLSPIKNPDGLFDTDSLTNTFKTVEKLIKNGDVISAYTLEQGAMAEALFKMSIGNGIGFKLLADNFDLTAKNYGSFVLELSKDAEMPKNAVLIAETISEYVIDTGAEKISISEREDTYNTGLESVFPTQAKSNLDKAPKIEYAGRVNIVPKSKFASPKVFVPAFPGTNCEYDVAAAFIQAGAEVDMRVMKNLTAEDIDETVEMFKNAIANSQIIALSGGCSGGDEPDGSGKLISALFRRQSIKDEIHKFLNERDGLMVGICNGFQALIKLGLVPYGKITDMNENSPTLAFNNIGRRQTKIIQTKITSVKSPWFMLHEPGDIHSVAISHGEGRFYSDENIAKELAANGQIAAQYVDFNGEPSMDIDYNPSGSLYAIESVTSPDGRILGKMGHTERYSAGIFKNANFGDYNQRIFDGAVKYFK